MYFACLEAVSNATKHASATSISVSVENDGRVLTMAVRDDGVGFDPDSALLGAGLGNIGDRILAVGGALRVESRPTIGTVVSATIPVAAG